jgi:hypothetical protein
MKSPFSEISCFVEQSFREMNETKNEMKWREMVVQFNEAGEKFKIK